MQHHRRIPSARSVPLVEILDALRPARSPLIGKIDTGRVAESQRYAARDEIREADFESELIEVHVARLRDRLGQRDIAVAPFVPALEHASVEVAAGAWLLHARIHRHESALQPDHRRRKLKRGGRRVRAGESAIVERLLRIGEGANEIVRLAIVNTLLRRDKAGRIPIRNGGLWASQALSRSQVDELPIHEDPLAAIGAAARDVKQLALFLLYQASERLADELMEAQEIVGAIADIVCSAYAIESVWLRTGKLRLRAPARAETSLITAQIAARDYAAEALAAANYAFDALPSMEDVVDWRDEPFTSLASLMNRLGRWDANPMQLRRDLAARVVEKGGYPL